MSSTLFIRPTPKPTNDEWHFKLPLKEIISRRFYSNDGGAGEVRTVGPDQLEWFEGVLAAADLDDDDERDLEKVVEILRQGRTIDMWIKY